MSKLQDANRRKEEVPVAAGARPKAVGRPPIVDRLDFPDDLFELLEPTGFFEAHVSGRDVGSRLPSAARFTKLDRLRATVARLLELSDKDNFEQLTGRSWKSFQRYLLGKALPEGVLASVCANTGVTADWLLFGLSSEGLRDPQFAMLPRYEVRAAAGLGLVAVSEKVAEELAFRRDWLSRMGINPRNAGLVTADGDSMAPTIPDGAIMLVDISVRDIRNGCIYVIIRDGAVIVKRVQLKAKGEIVLISDNEQHYERETISRDELADLQVAGRVMWVGHAV